MNRESGNSSPFYLPDFCNPRATLAVVLIVELTAIVLTLARQSVLVDFWTDLVRTSLFLLWIGLAGAGVLCAMRARLARQGEHDRGQLHDEYDGERRTWVAEVRQVERA
jgi:two-component system sensor histidine kinase AlgZ